MALGFGMLLDNWLKLNSYFGVFFYIFGFLLGFFGILIKRKEK